MKKVWKITKKLLFWIFFVSLFFITVLTVIIHIYQDDIKQYAINELNNNLNTDVEVRNIEVSIFHDFPNASIKFDHIFIADAYQKTESKDTLFFAEELFFNFNLWDIWGGNYKVKRASVHNGQLNLKTTSKGDVNYAIVKEKTDSIKEESNFNFLLELLKVENMDFKLYNESTNQDYHINIKDAFLRGDFAETNYQLNAEGDLFIHKLKSSSLTLIADKEAELNLSLNINTDNREYVFKKGDLSIEDMLFDITGKIDSSNLDLSIVGRKIEVLQVVNSIIPKDSEQANKYDATGIVNFAGKIEGPISRIKMPSIEADFSVEDAALSESKNNLKIYDINLIGNYVNAYNDRKEQLNLNKFNFKLLNSFIEGTGGIADFSQPILATKAKGNLDLAAFNSFFDFKDVEELTGNLTINLSSEIQFFDPEYRKDKFEILSSNGNISLSNITYKSINSPLRFSDISGNILVNGKDAAAKNLSIKTQKSDIIINGALKNFIPFIEGSGSLGLIASLESSQIDLNEFLKSSNPKEKSLEMFQLPANINLNVEMSLKKFVWDKHLFTDITGQLLLTNRKITVNKMRLKTLGGSVAGKLVLNNLLENGNIIDADISFSSINVKNLFTEWDNFKQKSITDKHLSGTVNGKVNILLLFNPYFSLVEDQIFAVSDIKIVNGELNNLETMKAITDYMRSNKALKLMLNKHIDRFEDKLMHLKFSEIKNEIEISNRRITIPKMTIKTNALDVDFFGWHDFDNNIEYHFSFRFRQLKTKPEYTEFGKIEDDGLGITIYMTMSGSMDEPVFSLDKEERKNDIKESIQIEKTTMKAMLKTEFGMFKKDTSIQQIELENKNEVEFIYYETDIDTETTDTTAKKTKNKKRSNKFFDKLKIEADKEEIGYEIDTESDL